MSAAGEALAMLPPIVPRFCTAQAPLTRAACTSNGCRSCTSADAATSLYVVSAPSVTPSGGIVNAPQLRQRSDVDETAIAERAQPSQHHQVRATRDRNGVGLGGQDGEGVIKTPWRVPGRGHQSTSGAATAGPLTLTDSGRVEHRAVDGTIARAAAQVAGERLADLVERRMGPGGEQRVSGQHDARGCRSRTALAPAVEHGLLDGAEPRSGAETLDGPDRGAMHLPHGNEAAQDEVAVDDDGARPALALAATLLDAGEAARLAQEVEKARERLDLGARRLPLRVSSTCMCPGLPGVEDDFRHGRDRCDLRPEGHVDGVETAGAVPSSGSSPMPFAPKGPLARAPRGSARGWAACPRWSG